MIENILILDTETTGLDPRKGCRVIEIAVILFNLKHKSMLQCFSTLLPCDDNPCESINHISAEATQCRYPYVNNDDLIIEEIWENPNSPTSIIYDEEYHYFMEGIIPEMANNAQAIVAHNAEFDRKFVAYVQAHRAMSDCLLLAQCFQRVHDLEERFSML